MVVPSEFEEQLPRIVELVKGAVRAQTKPVAHAAAGRHVRVVLSAASLIVTVARGTRPLMRSYQDASGTSPEAAAVEVGAIVARVSAAAMATTESSPDVGLAAWRQAPDRTVIETVRWVRAGQRADAHYGLVVEPAYQQSRVAGEALDPADESSFTAFDEAQRVLGAAWSTFLDLPAA